MFFLLINYKLVMISVTVATRCPHHIFILNLLKSKKIKARGDISSGAKCLPLNRRLGVRSTTTEWNAVALFGHEHSPQPPQHEANFRFQPAVNCR